MYSAYDYVTSIVYYIPSVPHHSKGVFVTYHVCQKAIPKVHPGSSTASTASSSKEQHHEQFAGLHFHVFKIYTCLS